jgi:carbonic anhydrase/acetyltransferase-like protein (isoleucine patch superfamily)
MALIKSLNNYTPIISDTVYMAENATIIGDVAIGEQSSIWFHTVIRGDVNSIRIGKKVNIQDGVIIHCTYQKSSTFIGDNVSIGHNAIIHGCEIRNDVLIGMGAIIMDDVVIENNSIIAAGSVVIKGTRVKSGSVFAGTPAKLKSTLSQNEIKDMTKKIANNYIMYSSWYN